MQKINRRQFLGISGLFPLLSGVEAGTPSKTGARLFFTSQGKTAIINADGSGLHYFDFEQPGQATWQPVAFFPDGEHVLLLSMEPRRDGPGKPFSEYYTQTPTHIWKFNLHNKQLTELATRERMAVFYTPSMLLPGDRMLVQVSKNKVAQIFNMKLDGSDAFPFTQPEDGDPYGLSMSPDGSKLAFHMATREGYQIFTSDTDGRNRKKIIGNPGHLYFGTSWSPDGRWILYVDCHQSTDPGHDWADVCISAADGSEHRVLTSNQAMWFASSYGNENMHGNGSNVAAWTKDGAIIFPRRSPGAIIPWQYNAGRVDTDHFNRDFKPEEAKGTVEICRLNVESGNIKAISKPGEGVWDFRCSQSPDGKHIVFCRAQTGSMPSIWVMDSNGENARKLTDGFNNLGADQPRWLPLQQQ